MLALRAAPRERTGAELYAEAACRGEQSCVAAGPRRWSWACRLRRVSGTPACAIWRRLMTCGSSTIGMVTRVVAGLIGVLSWPVSDSRETEPSARSQRMLWSEVGSGLAGCPCSSHCHRVVRFSRSHRCELSCAPCGAPGPWQQRCSPSKRQPRATCPRWGRVGGHRVRTWPDVERTSHCACDPSEVLEWRAAPM